ncbi:VWA domain-containing protein [Stieleria sp. JC731]|uniref:VWA domain-containing protein n=1 Tax=Stieleria sp. JC731 TaxID=2894195 RepID=UPI001E2AFE98|nr:VWA domain-containing protein [Stieleria sp. JC731]
MSQKKVIRAPNEAAIKNAEIPEVRTRSTPPMLLSLGLHLVALVAIFMTIQSVPKGSGDAPDRPIGIAMVHRLPDRDTYQEVQPTPDSKTDQDASTTAAAAAAAAPPADLSPPIDLTGILSAMESTPAPLSGSGIAGDTQLDGDSVGEGSGSKPIGKLGTETTAKVFGVSGTGSRFVYVFDRSDSMNGYGGRPLQRAKTELIRSLKSLSEHQKFQIIFYNENVKPFQPSGMALTMVEGTESNIERAERYVNSIRAFGGTKHKGALLMALRLSPDVIFFLTDAHIPRLSKLEMLTIADRAQRSGTTIHTIEFGNKPAPDPGTFLRELAEMNEGQYQYVDVNQFQQSLPNQ